MKFIITESKLENIVFKYLDNLDLNPTKRAQSIYFLTVDETALIKYDMTDYECKVSNKLFDEISSLFSFVRESTLGFIKNWVESNYYLDISKIYPAYIKYIKYDI